MKTKTDLVFVVVLEVTTYASFILSQAAQEMQSCPSSWVGHLCEFYTTCIWGQGGFNLCLEAPET